MLFCRGKAVDISFFSFVKLVHCWLFFKCMARRIIDSVKSNSAQLQSLTEGYASSCIMNRVVIAESHSYAGNKQN